MGYDVPRTHEVTFLGSFMLDYYSGFNVKLTVVINTATNYVNSHWNLKISLSLLSCYYTGYRDIACGLCHSNHL